jgi:hypothetical protein
MLHYDAWLRRVELMWGESPQGWRVWPLWSYLIPDVVVPGIAGRRSVRRGNVVVLPR